MSLDIANLRNRIEASKHADNYNDRTHVDVPTHVAERLLSRLDRQERALRAFGEHPLAVMPNVSGDSHAMVRVDQLRAAAALADEGDARA